MYLIKCSNDALENMSLPFPITDPNEKEFVVKNKTKNSI
jgi:hypothetical protein